MREFSDAGGHRWDVVAGRESWGAFFAIFVPRLSGGAREPTADREVRQAPLRASAYDEANAELEAFSEEELRSLLARSSPKNQG